MLHVLVVVVLDRIRMHYKYLPKTHLNEKKVYNLYKITKIHLFYCLYCVFWRPSTRKENNSGGKFSQEQLENQVRVTELAACGQPVVLDRFTYHLKTCFCARLQKKKNKVLKIKLSYI